MTLTEKIRRRLKSGQSVAEIAVQLGVPACIVRKIRWEMRHPDYKRIYMRRWRELNPQYEKRRALQRLIKSYQLCRGRIEERLQRVIQ